MPLDPQDGTRDYDDERYSANIGRYPIPTDMPGVYSPLGPPPAGMDDNGYSEPDDIDEDCEYDSETCPYTDIGCDHSEIDPWRQDEINRAAEMEHEAQIEEAYNRGYRAAVRDLRGRMKTAFERFLEDEALEDLFVEEKPKPKPELVLPKPVPTTAISFPSRRPPSWKRRVLEHLANEPFEDY